MKHLLTAALIATTLASPVRGDEVFLSCFDTHDLDRSFSLTINTSTWSAIYKDEIGELHAETLFVDPFGERRVTWLVDKSEQEELFFPWIIILERTTLRALTTSIDSASLFAGLTGSIFYQCVRPL